MLHKGYVLDNKYVVEELIGEGGMSYVYLCKNSRLEYYCAIKEIKKELKGTYEFKCEVKMLKDLRHEGIPRIIDFFEEKGNYYIVEDYVQGKTLDRFLKENKIHYEQLYYTINKLCDILIYLHNLKPAVIYRDLKPSNIMITVKGQVKLIDFGIARVYKPEKDTDTVFMGSVGYIAPELFNGVQSSPSSDIYSLGATLKSIAACFPIKSITLENIIEKAMDANPNKRYKSIQALKKELVFDKTMIMPIGKKIKYISRKNLIIVSCIIVSFLCIILAFSLNNSSKIVQVTKADKVDKVEVVKETPKPIAPDSFLAGSFDKENSIAFNQVEPLKGEEYKFRVFDNIYETNPKGIGNLFNNQLVFSVDYVEFKLNEMLLYCSLKNSSENAYIIGEKDAYTLFSSQGVGYEGSLAGDEVNQIVQGGEYNNKIIISFKNAEVKSTYYILKTNITNRQTDETHAIRIQVNLKN